MLNAYVITLLNNSYSTAAARNCVRSIERTNSNLIPQLYSASTPQSMVADIKRYLPDYADKLINFSGVPNYTWPLIESQAGLDIGTGLFRRVYKTNDPKKIVACSISHMRLWQQCVNINQPIVILEHDAHFQNRFDDSYLTSVKQHEPHSNMFAKDKAVVSLNDPRGATRRALRFHHGVCHATGCHPIPKIQDPGEDPVPEGLPGGSAYYITPSAALECLQLAAKVGIWPNDAMICRQLFPYAQVYFPYFTVVKQTVSTTTS